MALRNAGLFDRFANLGASDVGTIEPGAYSEEVTPLSIRNQEQIVRFSRSLSDRILGVIEDGNAPLVLGGDCSVLVGAGMALKKAGRYGLVHLDGHTDFRHPGNSNGVASLAGEDLAAAVGLHWNQVSDIDGLGPYFEPRKAVHAGCRDDDEYLPEARQAIGSVIPASEVKRSGMETSASGILAFMERAAVDGYWLHLDVDLLDSTVMPAVDSPSPGGLAPGELTDLLKLLSPHAAGAEVTIFDPDLDPSGAYARLITSIVSEGLQSLGSRD
jgi:arginase